MSTVCGQETHFWTPLIKLYAMVQNCSFVNDFYYFGHFSRILGAFLGVENDKELDWRHHEYFRRHKEWFEGGHSFRDHKRYLVRGVQL